MIDKDSAKEVPIQDYLSSLGYTKFIPSGKWLKCHSMLRNDDKDPSFIIDTKKKRWSDPGVQKSGDVISLAMELEGLTFVQAVEKLNQFSGNHSISLFKEEKTSESKIRIYSIKPITDPDLLDYFVNERCISEVALQANCSEILYISPGGTTKKAVGFKNNRGGWELRSRDWKGGTAPKGVTEFKFDESGRCYLFEGFSDYLSWLTLNGLSKPKDNVVVMNSIVFWDRVKYDCVIYYGDNDNGGNLCKDNLKGAGKIVNDMRWKYNELNDVNQYLVEKKKAGL